MTGGGGGGREEWCCHLSSPPFSFPSSLPIRVPCKTLPANISGRCDNRIENFCASQTPVAYLFLLRLVGWLGSLHPGVKLDRPPLSGEVMRIGTMGPKFTTTAPLVNLAWGEFDFFLDFFKFALSFPSSFSFWWKSKR